MGQKDGEPRTTSAPDTEAGAEIDLATFVLSLASSAMLQMGLGPGGTDAKPDLVMARQTIEIIAMLQKRTQHGLTGEEERLIDHLLYDLRMQYVELTRRHKEAP